MNEALEEFEKFIAGEDYSENHKISQRERQVAFYFWENAWNYQKAKIDAANNRVCVWSAYEDLGVEGVDYDWHKTECGESFPSNLAYHNYCINCGGKIEVTE